MCVCVCVCVCVCLTLYRLGPWTQYRLKTGVIRTSMTWTRDFRKKFSRKVTSGQITEEKLYATNAFLWEKYSAFCFNVFKSNHFCSFWAIRTSDHEIMLWEVLRQGFNVSIFIYIYNTLNLCTCDRPFSQPLDMTQT